MQHGMLHPLCLQLLHGKPLEQVSLPLEISLQCRYQQTLSETARTAQEVVHTPVCQTMYLGGFIHINPTLSTQFFKLLYTYRILHTCHVIIRFTMQIYNKSPIRPSALGKICGTAERKRHKSQNGFWLLLQYQRRASHHSSMASSSLNSCFLILRIRYATAFGAFSRHNFS